MNKTLETELTALIFDALKTVKSQSGASLTGEFSPEMRLYGYDSDIDSLGLVGLLIELEERVYERYGVAISLTDEQAMSQQHSPFRTVSTLADYLANLVAARHG